MKMTKRRRKKKRKIRGRCERSSIGSLITSQLASSSQQATSISGDLAKPLLQVVARMLKHLGMKGLSVVRASQTSRTKIFRIT
jgi:hypothetical protein